MLSVSPAYWRIVVAVFVKSRADWLISAYSYIYKVASHNQRDLPPSDQSQSSSRSDEAEAERWNNMLGFHLIRVDGKHRESLPNICPPAKPTRWRLSVIQSRVGRIWRAKQTNPSNSH